MKTTVEGRPIVGIEGLLKLVKVIQQFQASPDSTNEDLRLCHPELSPPRP